MTKRKSIFTQKFSSSDFIDEFARLIKDRNPLIVIVSDGNVTIRQHAHAGGSLQLSWAPAAHAKSPTEITLRSKALYILVVGISYQNAPFLK